MREDLKLYLKDLYLRNQITAERFKELSAVANDLKDANDRIGEYEMLMDYATGDYPEFKHFVTMNQLRAGEDLESIFIQKIDAHLDVQDIEKAQLMLDMMQTIEL